MLNNRFDNKRKILFIVAGILAVLLLAILIFALLPKTDNISYEVYYDGVGGNAVIFRQETFYDLSSYEKIIYENILEGQYVEDGTKIVSAYKKGYIKANLEKLTETEKNIITYQNQNIITEFDDKKIQNYDFEISVIIKKMSEEDGGYIDLHRKLCDLIKERKEYIRTSYNTESNSYLQELYSDELTMAESLKTWCDEIVSTKGFVGVYCDGAENDLNIDKAQNISYKENETILKTQYTNDLKGFKIVSDDKWYITLKVDDASLFDIGSCYPVFIDNEIAAEAGTLEKIVEERGKYVLVFSFADNVEKYIDLRITDAFVGQRFEGFSLKDGYVQNGEITVKFDKKKQSIPVNVVYQNDDIVIFDVDEQLTLGQKVYK